MKPQFPVYTECTFKCETPEKIAEPKDCAKSCEMVKKQNEKIEIYEKALKDIADKAYYEVNMKCIVDITAEEQRTLASKALKAGNQ